MLSDPSLPARERGSASSGEQRITAHKARVRAIRDEAFAMLQGNATGIQIAARISERSEQFFVDLYRTACESLSARDRRLIAGQAAMTFVGGSGRGELCPFSDIDLLFLYRPAAAEPFGRVVAEVIREGWDAGFRIGHAVRTVEETLQIAKTEPQVTTALVELRPLAGDTGLVERLKTQFRDRLIRRRLRAFYNDCMGARVKEREQHGGSPSILEPDVKRSPGGLRDVHLLRWIAFGRFGTTDYDLLRLRNAMSRDDARHLLEAYEFLLRVRIELLFAAGRESDVLTREEQQRMAAERGVTGQPGVRPVERFMQTYFRHATRIAEISDRFAARHRPRSALGTAAETMLTRRSAGVFWLSPTTVAISPRFRESVASSPERTLDLFRYVAKSGVEPTPETEELLRRHTPSWPTDVSPEAAAKALGIFSFDRHLGRALRAMYRCGVLEWLIPDMRHARCLIQFNQYHSFTIDEHCLRTVEAGSAFAFETGPIAQARRSIRQPAILNLALLLHDIGKGFEEDHCIVGREIAHRVGVRLHLQDHDRERLEYLVLKHLDMVHLALRRDITDPGLAMKFSHDVKNPETLRMLYVLSAADLSAVGPGVFTKWKGDLLTDLYEQSLHILSGRSARMDSGAMEQIKRDASSAFSHSVGPTHREEMQSWVKRQLDGFSHQYLATTPIAQIVSDLQSLRALQPGDVLTSGIYESATRTTEYRVTASAQVADGCFHKMAGVLSAKRLEILTAVIETTVDGTIVDRYRVVDPDHDGRVPDWRIAEVTTALRDSLLNRVDIPQLIRRFQTFGAGDRAASLSDLPLQVSTDTHTSDRCTIIDVFAHDRPGLLFMLTRSLYELGLSVDVAKISTHLDQVVDVFYVTTADGKKIEDESALQPIRDTLMQRLRDFEADGHARFRRN
jgi:[protein-PII] uridylyltransferase